jgi:hypothetical protein
MPNIKVEPYIIPQKSFDLSAAISQSDNLKFLPVPAIRQLWRLALRVHAQTRRGMFCSQPSQREG